jgi:NADPH:quinone reductase-like Zn-dependent oxidoreductase
VELVVATNGPAALESAKDSESTERARKNSMKAILQNAYGSPAQLELRDVALPVLTDEQLLIRVHASSVNPAEWYRVMGPWFARLGEGLRRPKTSRIGADLAGVVEAVGRDVKEFRPGDEVFGTSGASWAEYAPAREVRLVRKPANVSFEEAAAVPIAALTALQALRDKGQVQPGQKVLINGASGGVGTFAVQIAKAFGADVTAVCRTRNVDMVRSLGADRVVDYTQENFTRRGERHELMLDVCGSRRFREVRRVLTPDATIVVVGARMKARGLGPLPRIAAMRLASIGRSQTVTFFLARITKEDLALMAELLAAGKVKPVIDRRYELSRVPEALDYLGEGHARGKIVITV